MELQPFIVKTIDDIIKSITQLQEMHQETGAIINPRENPDDNFAKQQDIEFDIAVTVETGSEGKVKGGIRILEVGVSGDGSMSLNNSNVTRLKFHIPLILPSNKLGAKYEINSISGNGGFGVI